MKNNRLWCVVAFALALPALGGCAAAIVGGAATAALVAHDRRTSGAVVQDQQIELSASRILSEHPEIKDHSNISVTSYNMRVLLTGQSETTEVNRRFAELVSQLAHVESVYNEVETASSTDLWDATEDTYLTSKVKLALVNVDVDGFDPTFVKVVTSRSQVYLMGLVSSEEGRAVVDEVSRLSGVERVVEVFEYTDS